MALLLSNLAPDVIFSIFAHCDISSVISASQTCRYLHDLAFDKSVWLTLLDNLRRRSILDRTSNLETLSVAELIGIVRRLITGPQTWSPGELDHDPVAEVSKTITLHPQIDLGNWVKLLPSGCYVLFENQGALGCWSVVHDKLVWRHTSRLEHGTIARFAVEETDPGSAIVMICCCADQPHDRRRINFIEIVKVDFRTGTHNCLLAAPAPRSRFIDSPVICGPLAAVSLDWDCMVINWRAKSSVIIRSDEMPKLHTFHAICPTLIHMGMQIHASPIRDIDYRVWIWSTPDGLMSYRLSIPIDREPQWHVGKAVSPGTEAVSYSGHVLEYDGDAWAIGMYPVSTANPRLRLFRDLDFAYSVELATYSGAITNLTDESTIVIQYHK
ncbi:hypothetical protein C8R45DRAFT_1013041 [Mycena sanguinolenta]|nr:hypothetical protein C8R45DRAFT_1013041 [Mycena sanguinolenta]